MLSIVAGLSLQTRRRGLRLPAQPAFICPVHASRATSSGSGTKHGCHSCFSGRNCTSGAESGLRTAGIVAPQPRALVPLCPRRELEAPRRSGFPSFRCRSCFRAMLPILCWVNHVNPNRVCSHFSWFHPPRRAGGESRLWWRAWRGGCNGGAKSGCEDPVKIYFKTKIRPCFPAFPPREKMSNPNCCWCWRRGFKGACRTHVRPVWGTWGCWGSRSAFLGGSPGVPPGLALLLNSGQQVQTGLGMAAQSRREKPTDLPAAANAEK